MIGRPPRSRDARTPRATSSEKLPRGGERLLPDSARRRLRAPPANAPAHAALARHARPPAVLIGRRRPVTWAARALRPCPGLPSRPREAGTGARPCGRGAGSGGGRRRPRGAAASRRPASRAPPIGRSRPPTQFRSPGTAGPRPSRPSPGRARGRTRRSRVGPRGSASGGRAGRAPFPRGSRGRPGPGPGPAPPAAPRSLPPSRESSSGLRLLPGSVCKSPNRGWCAPGCDVVAVTGAPSEGRRCDAGVHKGFPRCGCRCRPHTALGPGRAPADRNVCRTPTELPSHRSPSYLEAT